MATRTMWRCRLRDSRGATNSVPVSPAHTAPRARPSRHTHDSSPGPMQGCASLEPPRLHDLGVLHLCAHPHLDCRRDGHRVRLRSAPSPSSAARAAAFLAAARTAYCQRRRAALATPAGGSARSAATRRQACAPCRYCVSAPAATASARSSPFSTAPWRGTPPDPRPLSRLESASSVPQNPAARPTAHRTFTRRARPAHDASVA